MRNEEIERMDTSRYYLREYCYYDGECFVTFNIVSVDFVRRTIEVAVTDRGKIGVRDYELFEDRNGELYFEYGVMADRIAIEDFETVQP